MLIDRQILENMLLRAAQVWRDNMDALSEIDSRYGDGDHGVTMGKIANLVTSSVENWAGESLRDFIDDLGSGIMAIGGGSAGPLYGSLIGGMAEAVGEASEIDGRMLKAMIGGSLASMEEVSKARVGDKTMMDALIPAARAADGAGDDAEEVLLAAMEAAAKGAKDTEGYVSKFGRARSYGEQTLGTPDAGALSTSLLFRGLYEGFKGLQ